jgi:hypothetical protein
MVYHIITCVLNSNSLRRDTRQINRLMQRLRFCAGQPQAYQVLERGAPMKIEGTEAFEEVSQWTAKYRSQSGQSNEETAELDDI